jgi:hypothetical protein
MQIPDISQLGGLPTPVDIVANDRLIVVRDGKVYVADMKALKDEMDDGDVLSTNNLSDLTDKIIAQHNLAAAAPYDDWRWVGAGKGTGPSNPARTVLPGTGIEVWEFANGKTLHADGNQIPHDYAEGTDIIPHLHFMPTTTARYTGVWTMTFRDLLDMSNGAVLQALTTLTIPFDADMVALTNVSANFSGVIPGLNRKISSIMHANLSLSLTAGASFFLNGWDGHYLKNTFGSVTATSKS